MNTDIVGEEFVDDILEHYGIKGMQWGVRRSREGIQPGPRRPGDHRSGPRQSELDQRAKSSSKGRKTNVSQISNDDLKKSIDRMRLEKQYKDLSTSSSLNSGVKFVSKHADRIVGTVIGAITTAAVGTLIKNRFG